MNIDEAIANLSAALMLVSQPEFDKEALRTLVKDVLDEKHSHYIEKGLVTKDKSLLMHGIMGALSHYEAEKEKELRTKKLNTITQDD